MTQDASPKSSDPMIQKLSSFLESHLKTLSEGFCIQNEPLQPDEIASHDGLLPLFLFKAAESFGEANNQRKLPLSFESDTSALIDVVPITEATADNVFSLWVHYLHYSVEEEIRRIKREKKLSNGLIPLDDLYHRWHRAVTQQQYVIKPPSRPQPTTSGQGQNS